MRLTSLNVVAKLNYGYFFILWDRLTTNISQN